MQCHMNSSFRLHGLELRHLQEGAFHPRALALEASEELRAPSKQGGLSLSLISLSLSLSLSLGFLSLFKVLQTQQQKSSFRMIRDLSFSFLSGPGASASAPFFGVLAEDALWRWLRRHGKALVLLQMLFCAHA